MVTFEFGVEDLARTRFAISPMWEVVQMGRLCDTLEEYWRIALEPCWLRVRSLLDSDIGHRARCLTDGGPVSLFEGLYRTVSWHGDRLAVDQDYDETMALQGRGIVLVPSAFCWERTMVITTPPWQPTLVYPARGVAMLWAPGEAAPEGLASLVGRTRAELLVALDAPRSTTELAERLEVTPGGASQHLSVLRGAGLVSGNRDGRSVLYVRTPLADRLVAGEAE